MKPKEDRRWIIGVLVVVALWICAVFYGGYVTGQAQERARRIELDIAYHAMIVNGDTSLFVAYGEKWFGPDDD